MNSVNCFINDEITNLDFLQQRYRRDRLIGSYDRDLSVDRPELDDDKAIMKARKEQRKRVDKEIRDKKTRDQDEREHDHDNNRDLNLRIPDRKKSVKKGEDFGLTAEFTSYDDKDTLKSKPSCYILDGYHHLNKWFMLIEF